MRAAETCNTRMIFFLSRKGLNSDEDGISQSLFKSKEEKGTLSAEKYFCLFVCCGLWRLKKRSCERVEGKESEKK